VISARGGASDLIHARRVEKHPPTLLICAALGRLPNVEGVRPTRFSDSRPNIKGRDPVGCPGPCCTLYALASAPHTSGRGKARTPPTPRPARGRPRAGPALSSHLCRRGGRSSWWSWSAQRGCCILVGSTVFPLFCGPGPGVCYHLRGHSFIRHPWISLIDLCLLDPVTQRVV
jgi:hypothetical protein